MAFLDIFRSNTQRRYTAAIAYQKDIERQKALFQAYIDTHERKLDLGEIIFNAAEKKRIPHTHQDLAGHATTPLETCVTPQDQTMCAHERAEMLKLFDKEFLFFRDEEWLERDEKKLLLHLRAGTPMTIINMSNDLEKSSEHLANLFLLFRTLSAILHKEELLIRQLQTDIRVIYELSDVVEKEKQIFLKMPIFKSEALFDELMASAHDAVFLASLDEKVYAARKKIVNAMLRARQDDRDDAAQERIHDPHKEEEMKICEEIYSDLFEEVGAPLSRSEDCIPALEQMERIIDDDVSLGRIVAKFVKDPAQIPGIVKRFRYAYDTIYLERGLYD